MMQKKSSWSDRLYRKLLRLLPFDFRWEHGGDMEEMFQDQRTDLKREKGTMGLIKLWGETLAGFFRVAPMEHLRMLRRDTGYALRMMAKNPGFTFVAILALALGIGANTAIFSLINALMLRPLPVPQPEQLVVMATRDHHLELPHGLSFLDYEDYRDNNEVFSELAIYFPAPANMSTEDKAERIFVEVVSGNFFSMLKVQAAVGRTFTQEDDQNPGESPFLVLGHGFWQSRFGGDKSIVGKMVKLNGNPFTVIGVLPEKFKGVETFFDVPAYVPVSMMQQIRATLGNALQEREGHMFRTMGRLRPGVTVQQASIAMNLMAAQLAQEYPDSNEGVSLMVVPETRARPEATTSDIMGPAAMVLLALVSLVLLIACANVANLLLARATAREKEIAIRAALGASRLRIIRQLLTETALLAILGGGAGLLLGSWATRFLSAMFRQFPLDAPLRFDLSFDIRVYGYTFLAALATGLIAGVVPAWQTSRTDLQSTLKEGGRSSGSSARHRLRNVLVVTQVAVSLALLICAGLFLQSLQNAGTMDLGFQHKNILLLSVDPVLQGYDNARERMFYREAVQRIGALPGVESATMATAAPFSGQGIQVSKVLREGSSITKESEIPTAFFTVVGENYFRTLGVPILAGRAFNSQDSETSDQVIVVNETLARKFWPGEDPLDKRVSLSGREGPFRRVIGVAKDGKYLLLAEEQRLYFYVPLSQEAPFAGTFLVRTTSDPTSLSNAVREEIRQIDPEMPVSDVRDLETHLRNGNALLPLRMGALMIGTFGVLGLVLASIGIYGVVAYSVSQRTHEIGVRMTLGARRADILRMVIGKGMLLTAVGIVLGWGIAFVLTRLIASALVGVNSTDPVTFGGVALLLATIALVACAVPARRASRVDPMVALRYE